MRKCHFPLYSICILIFLYFFPEESIVADVPEIVEQIESDQLTELAKSLQEMTQRIERIVHFAQMAGIVEKSPKLSAKVEEVLTPFKLGEILPLRFLQDRV